MPNPKVTLVGAGPGDPELITLKGMRALSSADVVLYDALIHPDILSFAPITAIQVFVGKKKGICQFPQDEINALLVEHALKYGHVVRLKGGDPFIFGRGHEELEYAARRGVNIEVVPGVSSSIAAPTAAGIPLTKRGVNESFWVLTGTLSSGELSNDIHLAAQSSATVIVLMGMSHLNAITSIFQDSRSPFEPIAIIQNATLPEQKVVTGTMLNIHEQVMENGISSPAVIVIGKVVNERAAMEYLVPVEIRRALHH